MRPSSKMFKSNAPTPNILTLLNALLVLDSRAATKTEVLRFRLQRCHFLNLLLFLSKEKNLPFLFAAYCLPNVSDRRRNIYRFVRRVLTAGISRGASSTLAELNMINWILLLEESLSRRCCCCLSVVTCIIIIIYAVNRVLVLVLRWYSLLSKYTRTRLRGALLALAIFFFLCCCVSLVYVVDEKKIFHYHRTSNSC